MTIALVTNDGARQGQILGHSVNIADVIWILSDPRNMHTTNTPSMKTVPCTEEKKDPPKSVFYHF